MFCFKFNTSKLCLYNIRNSLSCLLNLARNYNILGIETSCDDTALAIINADRQILSNCINSQLKTHLDNGGIIPIHATAIHALNIDKVANDAFKESGLKSFDKDVHAIAITNRPGLQGSLNVGLEYARTLAKKYNKPLIPIHHMQAHALMPLMFDKTIKFPYIAYLISGGHTLLAIVERFDKFYLVGNCIDEACGSTLDKISRRLGLKNLGEPYDRISGGACIELLARQPNCDAYKYFESITSIPLYGVSNCKFSFGSYASNVEAYIGPELDELRTNASHQDYIQELGHFCASLQRAIIVQLLKKLKLAVKYYQHFWKYDHPDSFKSANSQDCNSHMGHELRSIDELGVDIVLSGGCAANMYITKTIDLYSKEIDEDCRVFFPPKHLCNDNGVMIAWNGMLRWFKYLSNKQSALTDGENDLYEQVLTNFDDFDKLTTQNKSLIGCDLVKQVACVGLSAKSPSLLSFLKHKVHK